MAVSSSFQVLGQIRRIRADSARSGVRQPPAATKKPAQLDVAADVIADVIA
jgi:hypothetical protein